MEDLVKYIYSQGHRKIAYIHGQEGSSVTRDRLASFYRTIDELGLEIPDTYVRSADYLETKGSAKQTTKMVFVGLFLKSIFLILLLSAFFFIGIILYLYVRVKKMAKTFNTKSTKRSTNENKQSSTNEQIYDERPENQAKRKIFAKDEGEYVDFIEENN